MSDPRSLWQVVVDEAKVWLSLFFLPLTITWRWLRRLTRH
jgi:hypothetical protein